MFVITADQINSRVDAELAGVERDRVNADYGPALLLPADRNAGDELQALTADATAALAIVLDLTRTGHFSVGVGVGPVRTPLPDATREASGPAFFAARDAVNRAKRSSVRLAVQQQAGIGAPSEIAVDAEAILALLLVIRGRRSEAGWELFDLMASGTTQTEAAARLGISSPAASARAKAAGIRVELAARPALARLLQRTDESLTGRAPS